MGFKQIHWWDTRWAAVTNRAEKSLTQRKRRQLKQEKAQEVKAALASLALGSITVNEDALYLYGMRRALTRDSHGVYTGTNGLEAALQEACGGVISTAHIAGRIYTDFNIAKRKSDAREEKREQREPEDRVLDLAVSQGSRLAVRCEKALEEAISEADFRRKQGRSQHDQIAATCPTNEAAVKAPYIFKKGSFSEYELELHPRWFFRVKNPHIFGERTLVLHTESRPYMATTYHVLAHSRGTSLVVLVGTLARRKNGLPYLRVERRVEAK